MSFRRKCYRKKCGLNKDSLRTLIAGIERELQNLEELRGEMGEIRSQDSIISRRSMGSILHDFYNK